MCSSCSIWMCILLSLTGLQNCACGRLPGRRAEVLFTAMLHTLAVRGRAGMHQQLFVCRLIFPGAVRFVHAFHGSLPLFLLVLRFAWRGAALLPEYGSLPGCWTRFGSGLTGGTAFATWYYLFFTCPAAACARTPPAVDMNAARMPVRPAIHLPLTLALYYYLP